MDGPSVAADPGLGITGGAGLNRWNGTCQAFIDEDTTEVARGNQQVEIFDALVDLPQNFPVMPQVNDVLTLSRLETTSGLSEANRVIRFKVRVIDRGLVMLGKLRLHCRVA